jgi:hypothetical protein
MSNPQIAERKNLEHGLKVLAVEYTREWTKPKKLGNNGDETAESQTSALSTGENEAIDGSASHSKESNSPCLLGTKFAQVGSGGSLKTGVGKKAEEHPHSLALEGPTQDISMTLSSVLLFQIAQKGEPVTKNNFFEVSSHSPFDETGVFECTASRAFQGQIGTGPVQWSLIVQGAGKQLLLTIKDCLDITDDGVMTDEGRQYLLWEANVLMWLGAWCKDNEKEPESFPNPIECQYILNEDSQAL